MKSIKVITIFTLSFLIGFDSFAINENKVDTYNADIVDCELNPKALKDLSECSLQEYQVEDITMIIETLSINALNEIKEDLHERTSEQLAENFKTYKEKFSTDYMVDEVIIEDDS